MITEREEFLDKGIREREKFPTEVSEDPVIISIIITVHNGSKWIDQCLQTIQNQSILLQGFKEEKSTKSPETEGNLLSTQTTHTLNTTTSNLKLEISVFDDASDDDSLEKLYHWQERIAEEHNVTMYVISEQNSTPKGVGYGRNRAIQRSTGSYLCFQDIDDEMLPERLFKQYSLAREHPDAIIGCKFERIPVEATGRFSKWANELTSAQLDLQIYTGNGPTVIMPTWLCHRRVYERIEGGFSEEGVGCPEDLIFFYRHLDQGGKVRRVDECLLKYRYHTTSATHSVQEETIWRIRFQHLINNHLHCSPWSEGFTIWNAGKQGRRFFRHLPMAQKRLVIAFADVDPKKIQKEYNYYDTRTRCVTFRVPIVYFKDLQLPVIICMKLNLTSGEFERNLQSLHLKENKDYILFS